MVQVVQQVAKVEVEDLAAAMELAPLAALPAEKEVLTVVEEELHQQPAIIILAELLVLFVWFGQVLHVHSHHQV
jgi:hypothetical protein